MPARQHAAGSILYVSHQGLSTAPWNILTFDTNATTPTPTVFADTGTLFPSHLAFDPSGNLYAIMSPNNGNGPWTIEKFTSDGVGSVVATVPTNDQFQGLAFDAAGNLYASVTGSSTQPGMILKLTPDGASTVFASMGLFQPFGLAFDAAGNLYAANAKTDTIEKFTPNGVGSVFASGGYNNQPFGLAFDSQGDLYMSSSDTGTIERITPDGLGSVFAVTGTGTAANLAIDSSDNLYVEVGAAIEKYTPSGVGSVVVSHFFAVGMAFAPTTVPEPSSLVMGCPAIVTLGLFACVRHRVCYVAA